MGAGVKGTAATACDMPVPATGLTTSPLTGAGPETIARFFRRVLHCNRAGMTIRLLSSTEWGCTAPGRRALSGSPFASRILLNRNAEMPEIETICSTDLDEAADRLRLECFPPAGPVATSRDEFDGRSLHVMNCIDKALAAYGRLTAGPQSVLETWTRGAAQVPTGAHVVDYSRGCVAPAFRRQGVFQLLCVDILLAASAAGFQHVVASVIPGKVHAHTMYELGFEDCGPPVMAYDSVGQSAMIQPLLISCADADRWQQLRSTLLSRITQVASATRLSPP